jgi:hypothetical protein
MRLTKIDQGNSLAIYRELWRHLSRGEPITTREFPDGKTERFYCHRLRVGMLRVTKNCGAEEYYEIND